MVRVRLSTGIAAALMFCASLSCSLAADPKSTSSGKELEALRQIIEDQTKQIEALSQQIAHLTQVIETHGVSSGSAPSASPAPESSPIMAGTDQPVAEGPQTHTVTKGETLTSIAKHYKITVVDLEKVNKIENDRTLQIGQILAIPTATPSATPEDKKENQ